MKARESAAIDTGALPSTMAAESSVSGRIEFETVGGKSHQLTF